MKFELYQDKAGQWRWRLVAKNGKITADSGESFHSQGNARRAAKAVRDSIAKADIVVLKKIEVAKTEPLPPGKNDDYSLGA